MKEKSNSITNKMLIVIMIISIALTILWVRECNAYEGGMSISTMGCNNYESSDNGETWERTNSSTSYFTVFEFSKDYSFFKHTAEDITSMYLIKKGTFQFDSTEARISFQCQSDVGNNYTTDIFLKQDDKTVMAIVNRWTDGETMYMVAWYIKSFWINEAE